MNSFLRILLCLGVQLTVNPVLAEPSVTVSGKFYIFSLVNENDPNPKLAKLYRDYNIKMENNSYQQLRNSGLQVSFFRNTTLDFLYEKIQDPALKGLVLVGHSNSYDYGSKSDSPIPLGSQDAMIDIEGRNIIPVLQALRSSVEFLGLAGCYSKGLEKYLQKPHLQIVSWKEKTFPLASWLDLKSFNTLKKTLYLAGQVFGQILPYEKLSSSEKICILNKQNNYSSYLDCKERVEMNQAWSGRPDKVKVSVYLTGESTGSVDSFLQVYRSADVTNVPSAFLISDGKFLGLLPALKKGQSQQAIISIDNSEMKSFILDSGYLETLVGHVELGQFQAQMNGKVYRAVISPVIGQPLGTTKNYYRRIEN